MTKAIWRPTATHAFDVSEIKAITVTNDRVPAMMVYLKGHNHFNVACIKLGTPEDTRREAANGCTLMGLVNK